MKKIKIIVLFSLSIFSVNLLYSVNSNWPIGTGKVVPKNRFEIGLFQPLQYGLTDNIELSTFPFWNALIPNFFLKKSWDNLLSGFFATEHGIYYPTPFLRAFAKDGIGLLPPLSKVPHIFVLTNTAYLSFYINKHIMITPAFTLYLSENFGKSDYPTIDFVLAYHRMSVFHNKASGRTGLDFDGNIFYNLFYNFDFDLFILNHYRNNWAFENSFLLSYHFSKGFRVSAGYKFALSPMPYDKSAPDWKFFPLFDCQWGIDF
ncbi:MAG: hypothetical protein OEZ22_07415 [Spirochaetia bacterium]|nr:hypothetical protein [Spirochaetia bacterium]